MRLQTSVWPHLASPMDEEYPHFPLGQSSEEAEADPASLEKTTSHTLTHCNLGNCDILSNFLWNPLSLLTELCYSGSPLL